MTGLQGRRILVLEDEFLIALEASQALEGYGATVVGPAHKIAAALELIVREPLDAALLDINIDGETSHEVAAALQQKRIPIVVATGYGDHIDQVGTAAVLDKPYTREQLGEAFERVLSGDRPDPRRNPLVLSTDLKE